MFPYREDPHKNSANVNYLTGMSNLCKM